MTDIRYEIHWVTEHGRHWVGFDEESTKSRAALYARLKHLAAAKVPTVFLLQVAKITTTTELL
jgi:hypothetical protein